MFIVFDTHISRSGEANLYYPDEMEDSLLKSRVIFEETESVKAVGKLPADADPRIM